MTDYYVHEDWTDFRNLDGLQRKAGVSKDKLRRLVLKELVDNALDAGAKVRIGELTNGGYFVEDDGPGIDGTPEQIAHLFSISRPRVSTKSLRLPTRGALGNGLRVVAGSVLASGGYLAVTTRGKRIELKPQHHDGSTAVVKLKAVKPTLGTRIEIGFGPNIDEDEDALYWAKQAVYMAHGKTYTGKSSPYWYDVPQFYELLSASGATPVHRLVANLDAGEIVDKTGLFKMACNTLDRKQAERLLKMARYSVEEVSPKQLGAIGPGLSPGSAYATTNGTVSFGDEPAAEIPFVVEVWATESADMRLLVGVNKTPVAGDIRAVHNKRDINFFGCGLAYTIATASTDKSFAIRLNIITPDMPKTSDGKAPDLKPFRNWIVDAVTKAVRKAQTPKVSLDGLLPKQKRGRQSEAATIEYEAKVKDFCKLILQIRPTMDFSVGSRGWCYILERHGLRKGDFDAAESLITACRKSGKLPLDICAEDETRKTIGVQEISELGIEDQAEKLINHILNEAHKSYTPVSFWDDQKYYVEVATEKLDLRNLFQPVCDEFFVPIQNFKGWSDVNGRAVMMQRFKYWEARGKICVLLLCGDHDPGGLHITDKMRKNLEDVSGAAKWSPDNLIIIRFGLNAEFIDDNGLTWIDNLETSSGGQLDDPKHKDHYKEYVQSYLKQFGVRKCEANALVVEPEIGRQLCRDAIKQYVPEDAPARYRRRLNREQAKLRQAIRRRMGETT